MIVKYTDYDGKVKLIKNVVHIENLGLRGDWELLLKSDKTVEIYALRIIAIMDDKFFVGGK